MFCGWFLLIRVFVFFPVTRKNETLKIFVWEKKRKNRERTLQRREVDSSSLLSPEEDRKK